MYLIKGNEFKEEGKINTTLKEYGTEEKRTVQNRRNEKISERKKSKDLKEKKRNKKK